MAADMSRGKKVSVGGSFHAWLQLSKREQAEDGVLQVGAMKPAVGSAEIRELPGRAGPITHIFLFTAILSSV
jgi:hypothetical protein